MELGLADRLSSHLVDDWLPPVMANDELGQGQVSPGGVSHVNGVSIETMDQGDVWCRVGMSL